MVYGIIIEGNDMSEKSKLIGRFATYITLQDADRYWGSQLQNWCRGKVARHHMEDKESMNLALDRLNFLSEVCVLCELYDNGFIKIISVIDRENLPCELLFQDGTHYNDPEYREGQ
jgi:hypothetical protein